MERERRDERRIIGWKAIAADLGISVEMAKSMFKRAGVRLPKISAGGRTSSVYLVRDQLFRVALQMGMKAARGL